MGFYAINTFINKKQLGCILTEIFIIEQKQIEYKIMLKNTAQTNKTARRFVLH